MSSPPHWIAVRSAQHIVDLNLGPGETEAIALAKELGAFAVLLHDGEARQAAKEQGLQVTGTIGLLERCAEAGLLELPSAISKLKATNYYAAPELFQAALDRDNVRRRSKS